MNVRRASDAGHSAPISMTGKQRIHNCKQLLHSDLCAANGPYSPLTPRTPSERVERHERH